MENLRSINPGTLVKFEHFERHNLDEIPKFKRVFVCFEAIKKGFLEGCRPFIGLDGCHLKGPFGGIALSAVALDRNKGVLPLALAVVEGECKDSWLFFLDCLKGCIGGEDEGIHYTFMSDRQKVSIMCIIQ